MQRLFEDWAYSSAGRSCAQIGHYWASDVSDSKYSVPRFADEFRHVGVVPLWSHTAKIATIEAAARDDHELYGKLLRLDERTGKVPFMWSFYLLHGNPVPQGVGRRVLKMAERGDVVLPEHDYQVLKRWADHPHGF